MQKTNIAWTEYSWNPFCGCPLPLASVGCCKCWARDLHDKRHKAYMFGKKVPKQYAKSFNHIQLFPERLKQIGSLKKPSRIFIGSMGDLFCTPFEFIDKVIAIIALCPQHTFQVLTKRAERMAEYFTTERMIDWKDGTSSIINDKILPLDNLRLGVSVCNQHDADKFIPPLLQTPAAYRFLSVEPFLGRIDFAEFEEAEWKCDGCGEFYSHFQDQSCNHCGYAERTETYRLPLNQVIIGCESIGRSVGRLGDFKDEADWAAGAIELTEQCKSAGLRVFVKQIPVGGKLVKDMSKFPKQLRYQEE